VRAATAASDERSFLSYAKLHGDAVTASERQYAAHADHLVRRQQWMREQISKIAWDPRVTTIADKVDALLAKMNVQCERFITVGNAEGPNGEQLTVDVRVFPWINKAIFRQACEAQYKAAIRYVTWRRVQAWAAWMERPSLLQDFLTYEQTWQPGASWYNGQARIAGYQIWRDLALEGMRAADRAADTALTAVLARESEALGAVRASHGELSAHLARINGLQAEGLGTLYDLYDRLHGTRVDVADAERAQWATRKRELAALLEVPRLQTITVTATASGTVTRIDVEATGTHANGVYEYLFRDARGGDVGLVPADSMASWGPSNRMTRYFHATASGVSRPPSGVGSAPGGVGGLSRTMMAGARGGAGFTGVSRVAYSQPAPWLGMPVAPGTVVSRAIPDESAPGVPFVELPELGVTVDGMGQAAAWTTDRTRVKVRWSAADVESGVQRYEVAVYRKGASGLELVRDWESMGGRSGADVALPAVPSGERLVLAVRAVNGGGLTSAAGWSPEIRVDAAPPRWPTGTTIVAGRGIAMVAGGTSAFTPTGGTTIGNVNEACPFTANLPWTTPTGPGVDPRVYFTFGAATDEGSGVERYRYRIDTVTSVGNTAAWPSVVASVGRIDGAQGVGLRYGVPYYITIVPVDYAGSAGQPLVYGPFVFVDQTPPESSNHCAWQDAQGLVWLGMYQPAWDLETPVVGYQYRVVRTDGTIVRDWPADGSLDWTTAPRTAAAQLDVPAMASGKFYVDVRARNGHGRWTDVVRTEAWAP